MPAGALSHCEPGGGPDRHNFASRDYGDRPDTAPRLGIWKFVFRMAACSKHQARKPTIMSTKY